MNQSEAGRRPREATAPQINIEDLVKRAKAGDQDAYAELDGFLDRKLRGGFYSMGHRGPDLLQVTKQKIFSNLDTFDPILGKTGNFSRDWSAWVRIIARNAKRDFLRKQKRQPQQTELDEYKIGKVVLEAGQESEVARTDVNSTALLQKKADDILRENHVRGITREIVNRIIGGQKQDYVATDIGITPGNIRVILSRTRKILERELIFPAGYRRLTSFSDENFTRYNLRYAVCNGKLECVKFLNFYYATPESVARYKAGAAKSTPRPGDDLLESRGYVLAIDAAASSTEYYAIRYSGLAIKSGGRIYIKPQDLERLQAEKLGKPVPRKHIVPPQGFSDPVLITNSFRDYKFVIQAAKEGKIQTKKIRDRVFVIEKEATGILAERDAR